MDIEQIALEIIYADGGSPDSVSAVIDILNRIQFVYLACSSTKWGENIKVFSSPEGALKYYKKYYENSDNFKLSKNKTSIDDGYLSVIDIKEMPIIDFNKEK
jgi:hypothetical protein